jgi:hypothetical protein
MTMDPQLFENGKEAVWLNMKFKSVVEFFYEIICIERRGEQNYLL